MGRMSIHPLCFDGPHILMHAQEKHFVFKPLTRNDDVETAVYVTSPKAWNSHICEHPLVVLIFPTYLLS